MAVPKAPIASERFSGEDARLQLDAFPAARGTSGGCSLAAGRAKMDASRATAGTVAGAGDVETSKILRRPESELCAEGLIYYYRAKKPKNGPPSAEKRPVIELVSSVRRRARAARSGCRSDRGGCR